MKEGKKYDIKKTNLLYPDLSFLINGALFNVYHELGGGHQEKYYQKAVAIGLSRKGLKFIEQFHIPLTYGGEKIGKYFLDFLIEDKIIIELKQGNFIPKNIILQTKKYLVTTKLKLGIIACFTNNGVIIKRIINEY